MNYDVRFIVGDGSTSLHLLILQYGYLYYYYYCCCGGGGGVSKCHVPLNLKEHVKNVMTYSKVLSQSPYGGCEGNKHKQHIWSLHQD
jgi:hypothetical protein